MCMQCEFVQACVQCCSERSESTQVMGVEIEAVGMGPLPEVTECVAEPGFGLCSLVRTDLSCRSPTHHASCFSHAP